MKYLHKEDGIAMVTALMFTLICLAMIMTLLYYALTGTKMSAAQKKYRNSLEATYGGTEFVTKNVIPKLFTNFSSNVTTLKDDFPAATLDLKLGGPGTSTKDALAEKMFKPTGAWSSSVSRTVDPKTVPDFVFTLRGEGGSNYKVYSKIVDTVPAVGLIDESGIDYLDSGVGVSGISSSTQTPRTPSIYSVEVQGEAAVNPKEKAGVLVLYAY